jgi:ubiquinone/menaquinone biosynthesis C-methylase UbiE
LEISELYSLGYSSNKLFDSDDSYTYKFQDFLEFIQREQIGSKSGNFLDYGCGSNSLPMKYAQTLGYNTIGVEYDELVRKEVSAALGYTVLSVEQLIKSNMQFDLIFIGDVLEHLNDPKTVLVMLKPLLSKRGIIWIQGPLQGSRTILHYTLQIFSFLTHSNLSTFPPYHVNLFSKQAIKSMARQQGFEIVFESIYEIDWPAPTYDELRRDRTFRNSILYFLKKIDKLFSHLFSSYGSRSHVVLRKVEEEKFQR